MHLMVRRIRIFTICGLSLSPTSSRVPLYLIDICKELELNRINSDENPDICEVSFFHYISIHTAQMVQEKGRWTQLAQGIK